MAITNTRLYGALWWTDFDFERHNALCTLAHSRLRRRASPGLPLTCNRVVLMQHDNVTSIDWPGLQSLDIAPTEIDTLVSGGSEEIRIEYLAHALCSSKNHAVTFTQ